MNSISNKSKNGILKIKVYSYIPQWFGPLLISNSNLIAESSDIIINNKIITSSPYIGTNHEYDISLNNIVVLNENIHIIFEVQANSSCLISQ